MSSSGTVVSASTKKRYLPEAALAPEFLALAMQFTFSKTTLAPLDFARFAVVPLTTVAQPFEEMGRETANMLIDAIKNKRSDILEKPENRKLEVKLVIRKSTAALKKF